MKKNVLYIPLVLIFIVQFLDKEHNYFWIQILLLIITIVYAGYLYFDSKKKKDKQN